MFIKVLWQITIFYLLSAHCCIPSSDQEALKQLWLELSTDECGHSSLLMVPGFSDLSVYKGESIDRFICNGTEGHCSPNDQLCADCKKINDNVTKHYCDDSPPGQGHQPIEVSSGCGWHYQTTMNKFRYPAIVNEAFCSCSHCKTLEGSSEFQCEGVYHRIPILLANNRDDARDCQYDLKYQNLRVGCTCAKVPSMLKAKPIIAEKQGENSAQPLADDNIMEATTETANEVRHSKKKCAKSFKKCQRKKRDTKVCQNDLKDCLDTEKN